MLRDERDRIHNALAADRAEQEALNRQLGVASVGAAVPDHYDEDITSTRAELIKARTDHDAAEAKFSSMEAGHGPSSSAIDAAADEIIASDAGLVSMKTALNTRRATLISQMANLTPTHPQYKQDEEELAKIDTNLDAMMKDLRAKAAARIQLQLQADLQRTAGVESQVNGQLRQLVGAAGSATPKMQRSNDLASDISRLQARFTSVDEQLHNLMLEDNAPAAAYQVAPAVAPLGRTKSGVLRNAVLIVFAGLFFGLLAAVAAHKRDPRVYIARDVELVLGFAPMVQLPDFTEVPDGVAEEYLLRLASSIEHARKQSNLRSVVFTGTGSGTGVSTLVQRVGEILEAMGRPTVLADATGTAGMVPDADFPGNGGALGLVPVRRASRPNALLQKMAEEMETQGESLMMTDTAPLAVSAETEYLARFVDCTIVVIESGKTTRGELRNAAETLQRLDVPAVGFVLNRVGLAKADPAFRVSVQAIEKHLQAQGGAVSRRTKRAKPPVPQEPAGSGTLSKVAAARTVLEPEVVAAEAPVFIRSPQPAVPEHSICMPAPMIRVPVPDTARRFSSEVAAGSAVRSSPPPAYAPFAEAAKHFSSAVTAEPAIPISSPVVSVPFAQVAEYYSPSSVAEPAVPRSSPDVSAPSAGVPEQFSSALAGDLDPETAGPFLAPVPSAPYAEASEHQSSPEAAPPVDEKQSIQEAAAHVRGSEAGLPLRQEPMEPAARQKANQEADLESDVPWWLSESNRQLEQSRPPLLWQPAKIWTSQRSDAFKEPRLVETDVNSGVFKGSTAAPQDSERDRIAREYFTPVPSAATRQMPESEAEEAPANLTSRLSGLRNLLFVMGLKDARVSDGQPERPAGPDSQFDPRTERTTFDRTSAQEEAAASDMGGAAPRLVTAPPEFLPPKRIVGNGDREGAPVGESSTRKDRRAAFDGVQILPSRRGQYKKI
jgi:hypothetical protein